MANLPTTIRPTKTEIRHYIREEVGFRGVFYPVVSAVISAELVVILNPSGVYETALEWKSAVIGSLLVGFVWLIGAIHRGKVRALEATIDRLQAERDEARARASGVELQPENRVRLTGRILTTIFGTRDGATMVTVEMSVENAGAPSIIRASSWSLDVTLPGGQTVGLQLTHIEKGLTIGFVGAKKTYTKENTIYEKTANAAIERGGSRAGVLLAHAPSLSQAQASAEGNVYRVHFQDIQDRWYEAVHVIEGPSEKKPTRYHPGI